MNKLPQELIKLIYLYLDIYSIINLSKTCSKSYYAFKNNKKSISTYITKRDVHHVKNEKEYICEDLKEYIITHNHYIYDTMFCMYDRYKIKKCFELYNNFPVLKKEVIKILSDKMNYNFILMEDDKFNFNEKISILNLFYKNNVFINDKSIENKTLIFLLKYDTVRNLIELTKYIDKNKQLDITHISIIFHRCKVNSIKRSSPDIKLLKFYIKYIKMNNNHLYYILTQVKMFLNDILPYYNEIFKKNITTTNHRMKNLTLNMMKTKKLLSVSEMNSSLYINFLKMFDFMFNFKS